MQKALEIPSPVADNLPHFPIHIHVTNSAPQIGLSNNTERPTFRQEEGRGVLAYNDGAFSPASPSAFDCRVRSVSAPRIKFEL